MNTLIQSTISSLKSDPRVITAQAKIQEIYGEARQASDATTALIANMIGETLGLTAEDGYTVDSNMSGDHFVKYDGNRVLHFSSRISYAECRELPLDELLERILKSAKVSLEIGTWEFKLGENAETEIADASRSYAQLDAYRKAVAHMSEIVTSWTTILYEHNLSVARIYEGTKVQYETIRSIVTEAANQIVPGKLTFGLNMTEWLGSTVKKAKGYGYDKQVYNPQFEKELPTGYKIRYTNINDATDTFSTKLDKTYLYDRVWREISDGVNK